MRILNEFCESIQLVILFEGLVDGSPTFIYIKWTLAEFFPGVNVEECDTFSTLAAFRIPVQICW